MGYTCHTCQKWGSYKDCIVFGKTFHHPECYQPLPDGCLSPSQITELISDPLSYLATWKKRKSTSNKYFLTFTKQPDLLIPVWKIAVQRQLTRKIFSDVTYTIEHADTNIHCHAVVTSNTPITNRLFKSHNKSYGNVNFKKIIDDNGIMTYMSKESQPSSDLSRLTFSGECE